MIEPFYRHSTKPKSVHKAIPPPPNLWVVLEQAYKSAALPISALSKSSLNISIEWMEDGKRARQVVNRSNMKMTGKNPSVKNRRMMHWESRLELRAMDILEAFPQVVSYHEQPAEIRYLDESGNTRIHYPDLLVVMNGSQRLLLEIKADTSLDDEDLIRRTILLTRELRGLGLHYMVITESQLGGVVQDNIQMILRNAARRIEPEAREFIRRRFVGNEITLAQAMKCAFRFREDAVGLIYGLVLEGSIVTAMESPLCPESIMSWKEGA